MYGMSCWLFKTDANLEEDPIKKQNVFFLVWYDPHLTYFGWPSWLTVSRKSFFYEWGILEICNLSKKFDLGRSPKEVQMRVISNSWEKYLKNKLFKIGLIGWKYSFYQILFFFNHSHVFLHFPIRSLIPIILVMKNIISINCLIPLPLLSMYGWEVWKLDPVRAPRCQRNNQHCNL